MGINFEDRVANGEGLHSVPDQSARIAAIRQMADAQDVPLFINARTDLFLGTAPAAHDGLVPDALERESAYASAGANGFFVPGLTDIDIVRSITSKADLPINIMISGELSSVAKLQNCGFSRFSYGPSPFFAAMSDLGTRFKEV